MIFPVLVIQKGPGSLLCRRSSEHQFTCVYHNFFFCYFFLLLFFFTTVFFLIVSSLLCPNSLSDFCLTDEITGGHLGHSQLITLNNTQLPTQPILEPVSTQDEQTYVSFSFFLTLVRNAKTVTCTCTIVKNAVIVLICSRWNVEVVRPEHAQSARSGRGHKVWTPQRGASTRPSCTVCVWIPHTHICISNECLRCILGENEA